MLAVDAQQQGQSSGPGESPLIGDTVGSSLANKKNASQQYQRLTQLEHVLKRPDTYIGSTEFHDTQMWICDDDDQILYKNVSIVPGMFKIFDEILVNAADNKVRDPSMKSLKVWIDADKNEIKVYNDGKGIPIEIHEKENMYIPELIFGNLLTSSNYDDTEQKVTGGRNGFGAKLCNIFSTRFELVTADKEQVYSQVWTKNMTQVEKPKITKNRLGKSYTQITFYPDLQKFGMSSLNNDLIHVLKRRVWDIAGTTKGVTVKFNDKTVLIQNFKSYVDLFVKNTRPLGEEEAGPVIVYIKPNERWEVAVALSDGQFNQMSFVNSIATTSGGVHVQYITEQLVSYVMSIMTKKSSSKGSRAGKLQRVQVKTNLMVFINCQINNPSFTSQTKEQLTTRVTAFGSTCDLPEKFLKDTFNKTGLSDKLIALSESNADKELSKQDGGLKKRLTKFPRLEDANKAGTKESHKCTLILTEGLSAHGLAVAGLAVVGRDYYGCFPLRGKLLNVRDASQDQILKNQEIQALKQIIGLQHKKEYTSLSGLRYGHVMIMTDQDFDGSHIKGLIMNFLESSFPGLLNNAGFLLEFITPIVKVSVMKGQKVSKVIPFFTMPEYTTWRETEGKKVKWTYKYYKGLGSATQGEFRTYFSEIGNHEKHFMHLQEGDREKIELAFSKSKADERKKWLGEFQPGTFLDPDLKLIPISEFIDKELILFSMADNLRSIPSAIDGLKPGQRKVLWSAFQRNLVKQIKVIQLTGWVIEKAAYYHGEDSLNQTIINLAQDFVGTNNFYYLLPMGGFGSRQYGGKDAAASRYINTLLNPLSKTILSPLDAPVLEYAFDEDESVEPVNYCPILPMILVNGCEGIGTGWSTTIPSFNPLDIVANIRRMMNKEELKPMVPWFRGWTGTVEKVPGSEHQYRVLGRIEQIDKNTLVITELPVKMWTQTMREFLLKSMVNSNRGKEKDKKAEAAEFIQDFTEEHALGLRFVIKLSDAEMIKAQTVGLYNKFKLAAPLNTSNMVAFDSQGRLQRYKTAEDILKEFYYVRLDLYQKRKDHMSLLMRNSLEKVAAQARFIKLIIDKAIVVGNRPKRQLVEELKSLKFPMMTKDGEPIWDYEDEAEDSAIEAETSEAEEDIANLTATAINPDASKPEGHPTTKSASYDYLLTLAILSLTRERYEALLRQKAKVEQELEIHLSKSIYDLWNEDLDTFLVGWEAFLKQDRENRETHLVATHKPSQKKKSTSSDDDEYGAKPRAKKNKSKAPTVTPTSVVIEPPTIEEYAEKLLNKVKKEKAPTIKKENSPKIPAELPGDLGAIKQEVMEETSPAPSTGETTPIAEAAGTRQTVKRTATKSRAPAKKPAAKKRAIADSDSDVDMGLSDAPIPVPRVTRPRRAAAPSAIKIEQLSDESSSGEESTKFALTEDEDEDDF